MRLASTEESLEGSEVIILVMVGVLKLLDVSYHREVLLVYVGLGLERAEAFEDSLVWFVYFHL